MILVLLVKGPCFQGLTFKNKGQNLGFNRYFSWKMAAARFSGSKRYKSFRWQPGTSGNPRGLRTKFPGLGWLWEFLAKKTGSDLPFCVRFLGFKTLPEKLTASLPLKIGRAPKGWDTPIYIHLVVTPIPERWGPWVPNISQPTWNQLPTSKQRLSRVDSNETTPRMICSCFNWHSGTTMHG